MNPCFLSVVPHRSLRSPSTGTLWVFVVLALGCYQTRATADGTERDATDVAALDAPSDAGSNFCTSTAAVPGGLYWIGNRYELAWEHFYHQVRLTAFRIGVYEVTNGCYRDCVNDGACSAPSSAGSNTRAAYWDDTAFDTYPVVNVTRDQAQAYCAHRGGTLPTSAQRQAADTSAGTNLAYARDDLPQDPEAGIYRLYCRVANCEAVRCGRAADTMPVGSFPSSDVSDAGVLDLFGNVEEWTVDDWDPLAYRRQAEEGIPTDPIVVLEGAEGTVAGGGDFRQCGSWGWRHPHDPEEATSYLGFRCVYPER